MNGEAENREQLLKELHLLRQRVVAFEDEEERYREQLSPRIWSWAHRPSWLRYFIAVTTVAAAALVRAAFLPFLGSRAPFLTFYPAVMIAALFGGLPAGLVATALSAILASYWINPVGRFFIQDTLDLLIMAMFILTGAIVSFLAGATHNAQARASAALMRANLADERVRATAALRESEENLARAQAITHTGNWIWNVETGEVTWSDETYRIFGVEKGRFVPSLEANAAMIHPEDLPRQREWLGRALAGEPLPPLEARIIRPDGETRHILAFAEVVTSEGSTRPQRIFGTVLDSTDRKHLEQELRQAKEEAELRAAETDRAHRLLAFHLDNSPLALLQRDPDLRIIGWSKGAERIFGWKAGEVLGRTMQELRIVYEEDLPLVMERFQKLLDGSEARQSGHNRNYRKDREVIFCEWYNSVLRDAEGQIVSLLSIAQDVTWRVKAEEELKNAKVEADRANRAKSEFLANMSHEIRTPMNGIMGMTELASMTCQDGRANEYLQLARQSGQALLDIVNDILDLSKVEAGKVELERTPFKLREIVEELVRTLRVVAQAKGLALLSSIDPEVPEILLGDKGRLRQILTNLIGNGLKFTEQGAVALSVSLGKDPSASSVLVCFSVSDTGIGIPEDSLSSIFDSFAQAGGSAHVKYGGTGLGLSITKALVEMMGGHISVKSEEGKGATFFFTAELGLPDAEPAPEKPAVSREKHFPGKLKVLLAEDNPVNRILAVELLQMHGHEVETAESGQEVLEKLRENVFDLVLMDIRMPVMGGEEAAKRIRSGEAGDPSIPIVALTAHALKGDRERFLLAGMNDYLAKPFSSEDLEEMLRRVLG